MIWNPFTVILMSIPPTPDSIISNKQHREEVNLSTATLQTAETKGDELEEYSSDIGLWPSNLTDSFCQYWLQKGSKQF